MPRDEKKRQKAIMKKRSKQKAAVGYRTAFPSPIAGASSEIIRRARTFPLGQCMISSGWQEDNMNLIEVVVTREQPDGKLCCGLYLIDKYLLGLKNTLARTGTSMAHYLEDIVPLFQSKPEPCPPELAHQIIYGAIGYAAKFGFTPEKDFSLTQHILAPRGELEEPYEIAYGKNGKPFFISGPYDNVGKILRQLEKTAGPGNFDSLVMGEPPAFF
jgi:hypothetical protein